MILLRHALAALLLAVTPPAAGQLSESLIRLDDAVIRLHMDAGEFSLSRAQFRAWIERSAAAVSHYYGRFPVDELYVALIAVPGKGVKNGKALVAGNATVNIRVGAASDADDLREDWIMVHEMIHFALPRVAPRHHWIEEGLAVYVESIARANVGDLQPEFVWRGFVSGMPHGLPAAGDRGLDHTPTWGRTYWGGALFCLLADLEIRQRTDNRHSLRDALRAIVDRNLSMLDRRPLEELLRLADAATGETVLMDLYAQHRDTAREVDLAALWQDLGIRVRGRDIEFEQRGTIHRLREALTARDPAFISPR